MKLAWIALLLAAGGALGCRKAEIATEPTYPSYPCDFFFADDHMIVIRPMSDRLTQECKDGLLGTPSAPGMKSCEDDRMWNPWTKQYDDCLVIRLPQQPIIDRVREVAAAKPAASTGGRP